MVLKNIKAKDIDIQTIDEIRDNKPRNVIVSEAVDLLKWKSRIKIHKSNIQDKDYINRLLNSIENNIIIPIDRQAKVKRELEELRRMVS